MINITFVLLQISLYSEYSSVHIIRYIRYVFKPALLQNNVFFAWNLYKLRKYNHAYTNTILVFNALEKSGAHAYDMVLKALQHAGTVPTAALQLNPKML